MNNNANFNPNDPNNGQQGNNQPMNGQPYNGQQYNGQQYNNQPMNGQPYNGQQYNNQSPQGPKAPDGKGMSVTALVLGICSAFFSSFLAAAFPISLSFLACGVVGIVLAVLGRKKSIACYGKASGIATAGLVLSIIGTALSALFIVSCLACVGCIAAEAGAIF